MMHHSKGIGIPIAKKDNMFLNTNTYGLTLLCILVINVVMLVCVNVQSVSFQATLSSTHDLFIDKTEYS